MKFAQSHSFGVRPPQLAALVSGEAVRHHGKHVNITRKDASDIRQNLDPLSMESGEAPRRAPGVKMPPVVSRGLV